QEPRSDPVPGRRRLRRRVVRRRSAGERDHQDLIAGGDLPEVAVRVAEVTEKPYRTLCASLVDFPPPPPTLCLPFFPPLGGGHDVVERCAAKAAPCRIDPGVRGERLPRVQPKLWRTLAEIEGDEGRKVALDRAAQAVRIKLLRPAHVFDTDQDRRYLRMHLV